MSCLYLYGFTMKMLAMNLVMALWFGVYSLIFRYCFSIRQETEKSTKLAQHWPYNTVPTLWYSNVVVGTLSPTKGIQAKQWPPIFIRGANTIAGCDRVCGKRFPWWLTQRRLLNWWFYWKITKLNYYCHL